VRSKEKPRGQPLGFFLYGRFNAGDGASAFPKDMPTTADLQAGIAQAVFVYPAMRCVMGTMHGGQGIAGLLQDGQAAWARMGSGRRFDDRRG